MAYNTADRSEPAITGIEPEEQEPTYREVELTLSSECQAALFSYLDALRKLKQKPEDGRCHIALVTACMHVSEKMAEAFEEQFLTPDDEGDTHHER